jgi:uncharacterized RDD family membrane protein YckC
MSISHYQPPIYHAPADSALGGPTATENARSTLNSVLDAPKADVGKRFIALVIDGVISAVLGLVPIVGGIAGTIYIVVRDGLEVEFMPNRSFGKKVMGLQPMRLDGQPVDLQTSFRRNWMFGIGALTSLLLYIPILGWVLIPFVALISLAIGIYEIYLVMTDEEGRRWGDRLASTKVIEVGV